MNKAELVAAISTESGLSRKDAELAVAAFVDVVTNSLKAGDKIQLIGFGTFEVKDQPAREGRNPATGEKITIAASRKPVFSAGKALKDAVKA